MSQAMALQLGMRKLGPVPIFDLNGVLRGEDLDPVVHKIDQVIQKKKLRRVILNLQKVQFMDEIAMRKLITCLLRPQRSLVYAPEGTARELFKDAHLPGNVKLCKDEVEVTEAIGSFLFVKDKIYQVPLDETRPAPPDYGLERRRSKRIRVAIPIRLSFQMKDGAALASNAIATNVSQGGLFAEFLDLDAPEYSRMQGLEGTQVTVLVPPNETFRDEVSIPGKINRFELSSKQYGIAIQFV
jgi:hypothetical protein